MEDKETIKERLAAKIKELEDLKKRLPTYRDRKCGQIQHSDPVSSWERIEELEEEIESFKKEAGNGY